MRRTLGNGGPATLIEGLSPGLGPARAGPNCEAEFDPLKLNEAIGDRTRTTLAESPSCLRARQPTDVNSLLAIYPFQVHACGWRGVVVPQMPSGSPRCKRAFTSNPQLTRVRFFPRPTRRFIGSSESGSTRKSTRRFRSKFGWIQVESYAARLTS